MGDKKNKSCFSQQCCLRTIGVVMIAFGTSFAIFWPQIFDDILSGQMQLRPNSTSFSEWQAPSIPIYMDIYLFNWTNPEDFSNHSTKPIMHELGPYRFRELPKKMNLTWNDDNFTVSYRSMSTFYFDPEGSKGRLEDIVITVDAVAVGAVSRFSKLGFFEKQMFKMSFPSLKAYVIKTAAELLFDGYEDSIINAGLMFRPSETPTDRAGWFYKRNGTLDASGYYNVHTGVTDIKQLGAIKNWNNSSRTPAYPDKCGELSGSAGEFYPPNQTKDKPLTLLVPDICRALHFDFEADVVVKGLKALKFSSDKRTFDNGSKYEENKCFCPGECMPSGVLNISSCRYGAPVFMSLPHFLSADLSYVNQIEGMNPNMERHQFFMTLEPRTGIPVDVAARLQLNFLIRPELDYYPYRKFPKTYLPVMWFEQRVTVDQDIIDNLQKAQLASCYGRFAGAVFACLGLIMILITPFKNCITKQCSKNVPINEHEIKKEEIRLIKQNSVKVAFDHRPQSQITR